MKIITDIEEIDINKTYSFHDKKTGKVAGLSKGDMVIHHIKNYIIQEIQEPEIKPVVWPKKGELNG